MRTAINLEVGGPSDHSVGELICDVGRELSSAFDELIAVLPESARRPQPLAQLLGLDRNTAHRLMTAIRKGDPLATVHAIPGPEPLRRVTAGARRHFVPTPIAERAERAIGAFEALINNEGGDRAGLDAIISAWLPDARRRFERLAKQWVYRGARQVKGLAADVNFTAHMIHPASALWCDAVDVFGYLGLQRIRPEASLRLGVFSGSTHLEAGPRTLNGELIQDPHEILWPEYCSRPPVELTVHQIPEGSRRVYELKWHKAVGVSSARDIVMREYMSQAIRRCRNPETGLRKAAIEDCVAVPTKAMILDVLLHKDVFPAWQPQVRIMETGARGHADPNDPTRDFDILPLLERIEPLGRGVGRFRAEEIPHYVEMLAEVCAIRGWNPDDFRGYRTRIEFPVFSSLVQFVVDLPDPPSSAT
ncbi:MAG: hypothetical protein PVJ57_08985 [Phycisphaerae bacterium]|jgi:hypothetical protein